MTKRGRFKRMDFELNNLLAKVKDGNETAFDMLCEKYNALLTTSSDRYYQMTGGESDISVEDFRQEATLALFRAARSYDLDQSAVTFGLYAKTCIRNALVSLLRKTAKKVRTVDKPEAQPTANDPLSGIVSREALDEMTDKLSAIFSPFEYKVFLKFAEGKRPAHIAEELGKSAKSVSNALFRAREKLKESFRKD